MKFNFFKKNIFKRYLEIHLNSSRGTIARSMKISLVSLSIIILLISFFVLYSIINILTSYNLRDGEIDQYIQNKVNKSMVSDSLEIAAESGILSVIQPGGSIKDPEVISKADALGLSMVFTKIRHFYH